MILAAISTGGVIAIVVGAVSVIAGAFYALVNVQGERVKEAREDFNKRVETLDTHLGARITDLSTLFEQRIDALGDRLDGSIREASAELGGRIDTLSARLDRVEEDLPRAAS